MKRAAITPLVWALISMAFLACVAAVGDMTTLSIWLAALAGLAGLAVIVADFILPEDDEDNVDTVTAMGDWPAGPAK